MYLGPTSQHKGHKCISSKGRIYTSRHVVFDPSVFPRASGFLNKQSNSILDGGEHYIIPFTEFDIGKSKVVENIEDANNLQTISPHSSSSTATNSSNDVSSQKPHGSPTPSNSDFCNDQTCDHLTHPHDLEVDTSALQSHLHILGLT